MNAIEIMKANQAKYICLAGFEEELLLQNKAEAEKCLKEKDFVWLGVALEKMLKNNREILRNNEAAKMWETSANIAIKERDAELMEKTEAPEKSESPEKMKIENNTIYYLSDTLLEKNFYEQADKQEIKWFGGRPASEGVDHYYGQHLMVDDNNRLSHGTKGWFQSEYPKIPIIEWKIG